MPRFDDCRRTVLTGREEVLNDCAFVSDAMFVQGPDDERVVAVDSRD